MNIFYCRAGGWSADVLVLHKAVLRHQSGEEVCGLLGSSLSAWVGHVDAVEAELLSVAHRPLKVIQERPGVVASDWDAVILDGFRHLVGVVLVIVNSAGGKVLVSFNAGTGVIYLWRSSRLERRSEKPFSVMYISEGLNCLLAQLMACLMPQGVTFSQLEPATNQVSSCWRLYYRLTRISKINVILESIPKIHLNFRQNII